MSKATEKALAALHGELAKELTTRIKEGDKTIELIDLGDEDGIQEKEIVTPVGANVLSVARQFLKDNHIEADVHVKEMEDLVDALPFNEEPTSEELKGFN